MARQGICTTTDAEARISDEAKLGGPEFRLIPLVSCPEYARREEARRAAVSYPVANAIAMHASFKAMGLPGWLGVVASVAVTVCLPVAVLATLIWLTS